VSRDIFDFLTGQIDEDERAARRAAGRTNGVWQESGSRIFCNGGMITAAWSDDAEHIARHDPARVLAECAAKREIIAEHKPDWAGPVCVRCRFIGGWVESPCPTVRALASVYASRSGYQREWA